MSLESANRVTAIIGAGINLEFFDWSDDSPTCANITKSIVTASEYVFKDGSKTELPTLIHDIYMYLCEKLSSKKHPLDPNVSYNIVHFEKIFHILEMLDSYDKVWTRGYQNNSIPLFARITVPAYEYTPDDIRSSLHWMIVLIMEFINHYDEYFAQHKHDICKWYFDFWSNSTFKWDVFTLNYDTTIESSLDEYEDGFEDIAKYPDFQQFNPLKLLASHSHTINHLHGCTLYGHSRMSLEDTNKQQIFYYKSYDWYKWRSFSKSLSAWLGISTSTPNAQNGDTIFPSPIITGLNKTDKILPLPLSTYRYNLTDKLIKNNALIIAGYSFGDYYVNNELERMRLYHGDGLRVVVVDYWSKGDYDDERDAIKARVEHFDGYELPHEFITFLCKVMRVEILDYYRDGFNKLTYDNYYVSPNKQLMLFVGGWKKAVSNYAKEIYEFLNS